MKDIFNIGQLVKELNLNKETIRYYERIGLLSEPQKDENGYRIYSQEDIEKIKFILMLKDFGFSLKEISKLMHDEILCGDIEQVKGIVDNKLNEIEIEINELEENRNLLEKVKNNLLSKNIKCCNDVESYSKNKS